MTDDMPRVLEYVEKRLDEMMAVVQDLRAGQQQIIVRLDQTNDRMAEQFRQVNARIDQTNDRINETNDRINEINDRINDRFHAVNTRIDRLFWAAGGSILSIVIAVGVYLVNQVIPRLVGG